MADPSSRVPPPDAAVPLDGALIRAFVESSPNIVWAKDLQGRVTFANQAALDALGGGRADAVIGQPAAAMRCDAALAACVLAHDAQRAEREAVHERRTLGDGDAQRVFDATTGPLRDGAGAVIGVVGILRDVTDIVRTEARLRAAEERHRRIAADARDGESRLRYVLRASGAGVWMVDFEIGRAECSEEAMRVLGVREGGRIDGSAQWIARIHPDDRAARARAVAAALETGAEYRVEYRTIGDDGAVRWVQSRGQALPAPDGRRTRLAGIVLDVTERRRIEEALRESEARLRLAMDSAYVIAFDWDIVRDRVHRRRSSDPDLPPTSEAAPLRWADVVALAHPDDRGRFVADVQAALARDDGRYESEYRIVPRPDRVLWLHVRGRVERDADGRPLRLVGLSQDVTARRQAEDALREADRRKDAFLATLAHELRNPLAPVRNALFLLRRGGDDPAIAERARATIERQVAQMVRLVDDLLDVGRITRDKLALRIEPVDPALLLETVEESSRPQLDAAGVSLQVRLHAPLPRLRADPVRLAQVLGNLLHNAGKYTPRGGRVELSVRADGRWLEFAVCDDGAGLAPDALVRVFELFEQGGAPGDRSGDGLGIGLWLVRRLVAMHGGSVSAASDGPGRGCTFTVRLPLAGPGTSGA